MDDYSIVQEHKTFKGINDSKRLLDRSQYFKMTEGKKSISYVTKILEKTFDSGIIIPTKMRFCN